MNNYCPNCDAILQMDAKSCPECGFNLQVADEMFGVPPYVQPGVSDMAKFFSAGEIEKLRNRVKKFEQRFPQVFLSFITSRLPEKAPVKPYMFWLAERAHPFPDSLSGTNARGVLLCFDCENMRTGLQLGYALEELISPTDLEDCLQVSDSYSEKNRYCRGLIEVIEELELCLEKAWKFDYRKQQKVDSDTLTEVDAETTDSWEKY